MQGSFEPTRLFGVTTLDVVRASTFIAQAQGRNVAPNEFKVPVIGGHSGATILPLYSQSEPRIDVDPKTLAKVIHSMYTVSHRHTSRMLIILTLIGVQFGGDEIVQSKQGAGSATTCMAYAGFRFVKALMAARSGSPVAEEAYVYLPGIPGGKDIATKLGVEYFATKIELGISGATKALDIGVLSADEQALINVALKELRANIQSGQAFMAV